MFVSLIGGLPHEGNGKEYIRFVSAI